VRLLLGGVCASCLGCLGLRLVVRASGRGCFGLFRRCEPGCCVRLEGVRVVWLLFAYHFGLDVMMVLAKDDASLRVCTLCKLHTLCGELEPTPHT
jgi:hypothetical protein